ncbi:AT-hook motif nuclear-localized protein 20 [Cajanus cajan]|uniref:DNA-binding protein ESCAROLA n=1 Tax=Cajanus cajan TaxID=3821 RepID=A0A151TXU7_CAJCA|nr:AT-hook motif nuclear-localized protein 20 [Cajanus cajan]KYP71841.1 Putative DNA-binding protein ESCAROLA [Cajanus cajan]
MANQWWTNTVPVGALQPDLGLSLNDVAPPPNEEPKEGATDASLLVSTSRRPRGRPLGSKNKPKPAQCMAQDTANVIESHVIEIPNGADIHNSLIEFARRRQRGVCVMSATGAVANVRLRQPMPPGAVMVLEGRLGIVSLSGSFLPGALAVGLSVYVAGGQGHVVGGRVVGPLVASGKVIVIVAAFSNALYERLPIQDDDDDDDEDDDPSNNIPDMNVEPCSHCSLSRTRSPPF